MNNRGLSIASLVVGIVALVLSGFVLVSLMLGYPYFPFQKEIAKYEKGTAKREERIAKSEETIMGHEERLAEMYNKVFPQLERRMTEVYDKLFPQFKKVAYEITPIEVKIDPAMGDEAGKPEAYIKVYHRGVQIIKTRAAQDRFAFAQEELSSFSREIVFKICEEKYRSDRISVYLWEADSLSSDDLIAYWSVTDPMELENLPSRGGSYVKFKVKKGETLKIWRKKETTK